MLHHPALAGLRGTARMRFDSSMLWCGGPTIPRALARLAAARRELARRIEAGKL
jgi:iron complex transport system substrate-binding protein